LEHFAVVQSLCLAENFADWFTARGMVMFNAAVEFETVA